MATATGFRVTAADAQRELSTTLHPLTVTVCSVVTSAGAIYKPAALIDPTAGLIDHIVP